MTDIGASHILDRSRTFCLCCDGLAGHSVGVALDAHVEEHFVVVVDDAVGDDNVRYDASCAMAMHEQLGPLPLLWRDRVYLAPLRCGRPTKTTGAGCRNFVATPGSACRRHQKSVAEELK